MNKTLITFGDSFSQYFWPMWPEIIGQCFQEVKNFGEPGCGNYYIFQQFQQFSEVFSNVDNPTVIVQWTDPCRFDHFETRRYNWLMKGEATADYFFKHKKFYQFNSEELTVCKQLSYMVSVANFLNLLGIDWYYIFLNKASFVHKYNFPGNNKCSVAQTIFHLQHKLLQFKDRIIDANALREHNTKMEMPTKKISFNNTPYYVEEHPTPIFTYYFIKEVMIPKIKTLNLDIMHEYSKKIEDIIESSIKDDIYMLNTDHQIMMGKR